MIRRGADAATETRTTSNAACALRECGLTPIPEGGLADVVVGFASRTAGGKRITNPVRAELVARRRIAEVPTVPTAACTLR
jgi:hypothetical protein